MTTGPELTLRVDRVLSDEGFAGGALSIANGRITADRAGPVVDLDGYWVLPGMVDLHGDGFERHLAPRRGAVRDLSVGLAATEAELAACGITTACLAQFWSWEGGMRGPAFARAFLSALSAYQSLGTDMRAQLRVETNMIEDFAEIRQLVAAHGVGYVVFNDHLPHAALAKGKRPPRLAGQALKAGRSPEAHLEMLQAMHARLDEVETRVDALASDLAGDGVLLGSHDDETTEQRATWAERGAAVTEFPLTRAAATGASAVVLGAPNLVRGQSHKGNVSAIELVRDGLCHALASDYHYPTLAQAAFRLFDDGADMALAWDLVSRSPARILGLTDRGVLRPGARGDLVIVHAETRRIEATMAAGRFTHLSGNVASAVLQAR